MSEVWLVEKSEDNGRTWKVAPEWYPYNNEKDARDAAGKAADFAAITNGYPRGSTILPRYRPQQYIKLYPPVVEKPFVLEVPSEYVAKSDICKCFVDHIKDHLREDQVVICKFCGRTIDEIYQMQTAAPPGDNGGNESTVGHA